MKKRFLVALILLLLLSTYSIQDTFNLNSKFKVSEVIVENNFILEKKKIREKLLYLFNTNLFILNTKKIELMLTEIDMIDSFEIKKIYPNKIKIKIFEKKPVAIIQNKKEKKYYTNKGDVVSFFHSERFDSLPLVFGDKDSFRIFYNELKNISFPIHEIKKFYLYESKRWDLITYKNQTIKLPIENYTQSLISFVDLKNRNNFKKYKIFDYRIKNQLILK